MQLFLDQIAELNRSLQEEHTSEFEHLASKLEEKGHDVNNLVKKIAHFHIATPSWALGTGGTRFGKFPGAGEPDTLEQKIEDIGLLKALSHQTSSVSLHIPWDTPKDAAAIREQARNLGIRFDAVNSNTFQDQPDFANAPKRLSYKFGSMCHSDKRVREQAIKHNLDCIHYGEILGSKALSIWLGDGTNFPGQANFRLQFQNVLECLRHIYQKLPEDWLLLTEHKAFEPNFYSSVISDWGSNLLLSQKTGERCLCLVDLGHHLPNTNVEQIVSRLLMEGRLGGFHFNDSKYADDDLTTGCIKPYQLFLIFNELVEFLEEEERPDVKLAWMIDASHNTKDPLEDLLQSYESIALAYGQALLINRPELVSAQQDNDTVLAQEILQSAYRTDVRPLVAEARQRYGAALRPIEAFRKLEVRQTLIKERSHVS